MVVVTVVAIGAELLFSTLSKSSSGGSGSPRQTATAGQTAVAGQTATAASGPSQFGVVVQGNGGHWTNVTPDQLAQMLEHKDFTLVNVKTPYVGEIAGTDLYIPYDTLTARASTLPADKSARILVYCRTGTTSKIAAQALLDLGYTNVWNLAGGMAAWEASGRALVQVSR
jgi:rhodanese-related sulfurtransferase